MLMMQINHHLESLCLFQCFGQAIIWQFSGRFLWLVLLWQAWQFEQGKNSRMILGDVMKVEESIGKVHLMLLKASGCLRAVKILSLCLTWLALFSIFEAQMQRSECFLRKYAYIIRIILPQVQFSQISLKRPIVYTLLFFSARTNSRNLLTSQLSSYSRFFVNIFLMRRGCSRMKENTAFMQFLGMFLVSSLERCCLRLSSSDELQMQEIGFSSLLGFMMLSMSMQLSQFGIASASRPPLSALSSSIVTVSPCSWLSGQLAISQQFQGQRSANCESPCVQNSLGLASVGCGGVDNAFLEGKIVFLQWLII